MGRQKKLTNFFVQRPAPAPHSPRPGGGAPQREMTPSNADVGPTGLEATSFQESNSQDPSPLDRRGRKRTHLESIQEMSRRSAEHRRDAFDRADVGSAPGVEIAGSQPEMERRLSGPESDTRQEVFERVKAAVADQQFETQHWRLEDFKAALPRPDCSDRARDIFQRLHHCAPIVTNAELHEIFDLSGATLITDYLPIGYHFYIRTWTLTRAQLQQLVNFVRDGQRFTAEWQRILDSHSGGGDGKEVFTVRYIGTTCKKAGVGGEKSARLRHEQDLRGSVSSGTREFTEAVAACCPDVQVEIFTLPAASVQSPTIADDMERYLIELFHYPSLLNSHRGGKKTSFGLTAEDQKMLARLEVGSWWSSSLSCTTPASVILERLERHFSSLYEHVSDNQSDTLTSQSSISDGLQQLLVKEATPQLYRSTTLLALVLDRIPVSAFTSEKSSWESDLFTKSVLYALRSTVMADEIDREHMETFLSPSFCSAFLWPWPTGAIPKIANDSLREQLSIVMPLIVVSFGRTVSSVTQSNFSHCAPARDSFTKKVGTVTLQNLSRGKPSGQRQADFAFINILQSRELSLCNQDLPQRRLEAFVWQIIFIHQQVAIDVLDSYAGSPTTVSRMDICCEILARVQKLRLQPQFAHFYEAFEKAREDAATVNAANLSRASTENLRCVLNGEGARRLAEIGRAEGPPQSDERKRQLERLWKCTDGPLYIAVPHDELHKEEWMSSFMQLQEHQFLFLAVLCRLPLPLYTSAMLEVLQPEWSCEDSWVHNNKETSTIAIRAGVWLEKVPKSSTTSDASIAHSQFPQEFATAAELQCRPVGLVASNGQARIRWRTAAGHAKVVLMQLKALHASSSDEPRCTRSLHFSADGIDVLEASGKSLSPVKNTPAIGLDTIRYHEGLREMWIEVLRAYAIPIPTLGASPTRTWPAKGLAALSQRTKTENPIQNKPVPNEGDANFPLYRFLEVHCPTKRRVALNTARIEFVKFLKQPEYTAHPYADWWLFRLDNAVKTSTRVLINNMAVFRDCRWGDKSMTALIIAEPGSAFDDPFDDSHQQVCLPTDRLRFGQGGEQQKINWGEAKMEVGARGHKE